MENSVRVILLSTYPRNPHLEFILIFPCNSEKHYAFDEHGIRQYRGLSEREIIEACAGDFLADIGQASENIKLIFL